MSALALATVLALAARPDCGGGHGVEASRLAAMAQAESDFDPLAINVNGAGGGELHPATIDQAIAAAQILLARGRSIDLGLLQINGANLARHHLTVESAFDACASLRAGAEHVAADFQAAWNIAHRLYNCGRADCGVAYAASIDRIQAGLAPTTQRQYPIRRPPDPGDPAPAAWNLWARAEYYECHPGSAADIWSRVAHFQGVDPSSAAFAMPPSRATRPPPIRLSEETTP